MNDIPSNIAPSITARVRSELGLKLALAVGLNLWVYLSYHFLQHHRFFSSVAVSLTPLDRRMPFSEWAVWIYLSLYLLDPIGPFLMDKRSQIIRYAIGILLIGAMADVVFLFWPTSCPRPSAPPATWLYRWLVTIDNPFNALPSLHAAFAVFSALTAQRVFREMGTGVIWAWLLWLWAGLILIATLLTKQHTVLDLVAGAALAVAANFFVYSQGRAATTLAGARCARPVDTPLSESNTL